jgi:hypothetical protein
VSSGGDTQPVGDAAHADAVACEQQADDDDKQDEGDQVHMARQLQGAPLQG